MASGYKEIVCVLTGLEPAATWLCFRHWRSLEWAAGTVSRKEETNNENLVETSNGGSPQWRRCACTSVLPTEHVTQFVNRPERDAGPAGSARPEQHSLERIAFSGAVASPGRPE